MSSVDSQAAVPRTFVGFLRSLGPGVVIVLTWLGAGDIVQTGVAGGDYGYALMWIIVIAVLMRALFVSLIAKYQLCNERREGVLDGLARLHPWYAPGLTLLALLMSHVYGAYFLAGLGEVCTNLTGWGQNWHWALFWALVALTLVFRPVYGHVEWIFKGLLVLLSVSLLGTAAWVGPSPSGILEGIFALEMPAQQGRFDALLLASAMIGAMGGSLANLLYPYFLEQKGWNGPQYRRVQTYDFALAVIVMTVLNLAVWTLGAELLHSRGGTIDDVEDLARLLALVLGAGGRVLFYLGVFAALFTSLVGTAMGLAYMASHGYLRFRHGADPIATDYRTHPMYRIAVVWALLSPVVWSLPGMPDFITLTLIANSAQVVLIPMLVGGLWWLTASSTYIGPRYRNRPWENAVMLLLLLLGLVAAYGAVQSVAEQVQKML